MSLDCRVRRFLARFTHLLRGAWKHEITFTNVFLDRCYHNVPRDAPTRKVTRSCFCPDLDLGINGVTYRWHETSEHCWLGRAVVFGSSPPSCSRKFFRSQKSKTSILFSFFWSYTKSYPTLLISPDLHSFLGRLSLGILRYMYLNAGSHVCIWLWLSALWFLVTAYSERAHRGSLDHAGWVDLEVRIIRLEVLQCLQGQIYIYEKRALATKIPGFQNKSEKFRKMPAGRIFVNSNLSKSLEISVYQCKKMYGISQLSLVSGQG